MKSDSLPHDSRLTIHDILHQYWGFPAFRPLQEEVIQSVLAGQDTLALMPTGGGKSLCYQVPAMVLPGLCLVISPLIALMKDQVENLRRKNITAFAIYSGMSRKEVINVLKVVTESNCKFLYVSPERIETALFKEYLPGMGVQLIAVDEAHCISQWGYDFRPPYLRIAALREELKGVPVLALTASATAAVQQDICDKLSSPDSPTASHLTPLPGRGEHSPQDERLSIGWKIFRQSFERPNLSYSVFRVDAKINKIQEILAKVPGTAIIYCKSRKRTKEISDLLQLQQISSDYYHAGLGSEERNRKQEEWIRGQTRVIVCTNAFGMGIDKPDVRVVIHADLPDCLENYYQEAGRAGRDGKRSYAVLLFDEKSLAELQELSTLRFPSQQDIRAVYQAVVNYLQLHPGEGGGEYYDFDMADFIKKFNLNSHTALYALKSLEQEGWMAFNEQVFLPSFAGFTATKDWLYRFELENPSLEPLIKTLLRAYGGIFDQPVAISEKMLAGLVRTDESSIKQQLSQLHQAGIMEYRPQKDKPQLLVLRSRVRTEELSLNMVAIARRKEEFEKRIRAMTGYVKESRECRSRLIGGYFGDKNIPTCGICDNCLSQKQTTLSKEEFNTLHHRILNMVKYEQLKASDLVHKLSGIKKEKAWKVIEFLQAENKIDVDLNGVVRLK